MFGDDFFGGGGIDDLFNQLSGRGGRQTVGNRQANNLLSITGNNKIKYFVFDLSGKKLNSVEIKDDLEVNDYGEKVHNGQKILEVVVDSKTILKYPLPKELRKRSLEHTFVNGILEVRLEK